MRDWLAHRARATPDATALVAPARPAGDPTAVTYATLDERVETLAGRLARAGVGVDDHLGVCLPTRPAFVELAHAAMRLGAVVVPLQNRLTAAELADRVDRADVAHVVAGRTTAATAASAIGSAGREPSLLTVDESGSDGRANGEADAEPVALPAVEPATFDLGAWDPDCRLLVATTSGTTGRPKPVELTVGNVRASAVASAWRLGVLPTDRWHCTLPMAHVGGLAPVYRAVLYGIGLVVEDARGGFDPAYTLRAMAGCGATCASLVPTTLARLLDASAGEGAPDFSADLRFVLLGGAAAPESLVARARERGVPVAPTYGTTETASQVATARPGDVPDAPGSVGTPLLFTDVTVRDGDGVEREPGEVGELVVRGPTVSPGYYGDDAATARARSPDGFHTGDAGYRDEAGRLWVLGRLDDRINTGGELVDPGEVADALRAHPDVADAAVLGLPDADLGERVAALVDPAGPESESESDLTAEALDEHLRDRLAGFKLPRTVAFGEVPRTASGTVERAAARDRLLAVADEP